MEQLENYSVDNLFSILRDGCLGYRVLSEEEYEKYSGELKRRMDRMALEVGGRNERAKYRIQQR